MGCKEVVQHLNKQKPLSFNVKLRFTVPLLNNNSPCFDAITMERRSRVLVNLPLRRRPGIITTKPPSSATHLHPDLISRKKCHLIFSRGPLKSKLFLVASYLQLFIFKTSILDSSTVVCIHSLRAFPVSVSRHDVQAVLHFLHNVQKLIKLLDRLLCLANHPFPSNMILKLLSTDQHHPGLLQPTPRPWP